MLATMKVMEAKLLERQAKNDEIKANNEKVQKMWDRRRDEFKNELASK